VTAEDFVAAALKHCGYRASPGGRNDFTERMGYTSTGVPWSGAFIDVVARDAGVDMPACIYSPNGLAEFIHQRRWRNTPKPGDIVFYAFPIDVAFGMPHCGIVTGVSRWKIDGTFYAVEAGVNAGLPRAQKDNDGIHERIRWKYDALGFGRPNFNRRPARSENNSDGQPFWNRRPAIGANNGDGPQILVSQILPGKKHKTIAYVQNALIIICNLKGHKLGHFDEPTRKAYARWQRMIGVVSTEATGIPNPSTLIRLGKTTGCFRLDEGDVRV